MAVDDGPRIKACNVIAQKFRSAKTFSLNWWRSPFAQIGARVETGTISVEIMILLLM